MSFKSKVRTDVERVEQKLDDTREELKNDISNVEIGLKKDINDLYQNLRKDIIWMKWAVGINTAAIFALYVLIAISTYL